MSTHDVALFPRDGGGWRLLVGGTDLAEHVAGITVEVGLGDEPPVVTLVLRPEQVDLALPGSDVRLECRREARPWETRADAYRNEPQPYFDGAQVPVHKWTDKWGGTA